LYDAVGGIVSFVGIGSNESNPVARCVEAVNRIAVADGVSLVRCSSFYETEPVGYEDQPWFVNAVCEIRTNLGAEELLVLLQSIETIMGRRHTVRWGPRTIDLDIELYGNRVIEKVHLTIPHRELHKRCFVLVPLAEIAPYAVHPLFGISMAGLLERVEDKHTVRRIENACNTVRCISDC